ncbi:hypothetical protein Pan44_53670 [Caulifigura coniformis]|uniref:Uncharacterized protein n=1 Tax=Caulifigura coniformis TaxID=2527983 RepID=A0A517SME8_9PLAN|nr:hypothetical protein [Caulifigura coniformis]QDT57299.1 hypothetical protein Pan44_53670 [Caulifigura coniformis]
MSVTLQHSVTRNIVPAPDHSSPEPVDWNRLRNAIRKRLRHHFRTNDRNWTDFDDATQDACGFAVAAITRGIAPGLAVFRAVGRVKRGQTLNWEPTKRSERPWEERADFSRSLNGVSQATRRASAGLPLSGSTSLN